MLSERLEQLLTKYQTWCNGLGVTRPPPFANELIDLLLAEREQRAGQKPTFRAVVRHKFRDISNGCKGADIFTIDFDAPELDRALRRGGFSESGYDYYELAGVELLDPPAALAAGEKK